MQPPDLARPGPAARQSHPAPRPARRTQYNTMAHADPYDGIDFEEVTEATGLAADEIKCLKVDIQNHILSFKVLSFYHFLFFADML